MLASEELQLVIGDTCYGTEGDCNGCKDVACCNVS